MVRHASDRQKGATLISYDPGDVGVEVIPESGMDEGHSILGAEDEVIQELAERMGHGRLWGDPPFEGADDSAISTHKTAKPSTIAQLSA